MPPESEAGQASETSLREDLSSLDGSPSPAPAGAPPDTPVGAPPDTDSVEPDVDDDSPESLRAWAKTLEDGRYAGIIDKYDDDSSYVLGTLEAARKLGERNELAELGKRLQSDPYGLYQELHSQYGGNGQPSKPEPSASPATDDVVYDPTLRDWLDPALNPDGSPKVDSAGNPVYVPKPGAPEGVVQKWHRGQKALNDFVIKIVNSPRLRQFVDDPEKFDREYIEKAGQTFEQREAARRAQEASQQRITAFKEAHRSVLLDKDNQLTPTGVRLCEEADRISAQKGLGVDDALEWAWDRLSGQQSKQTAPPIPAAAKHKRSLGPGPQETEAPEGESLGEALKRRSAEMAQGD